MKKCPNCEKTFDDNLKFCQADGTPLIAVEEPLDPYKTTVANKADLPIPPLDPPETTAASPLPAEEPVLEVAEEEPEEEIDLLKTMVSTDFPFAKDPGPDVVKEPIVETPASNLENVKVDTVAEQAEDVGAASPELPSFSEPDINPPSFGDVTKQAESAAVEDPVDQEESVELELPPSSPFENADSRDSRPNDLSNASPYGDVENAPIPSPFSSSLPPGYKTPSAPFPSSTEPEIENVENLNLPVTKEGQQLEKQGWNPPASPNAAWEGQQIVQNTPFQPQGAGVAGQNKTLAMISLVLGGLGVLILIPSLIITICGIGSFFLGIGAIITGFLARSRAKSQPDQYGGAGLGTGGIVLGVLSVLGLFAIVILYVVILAAPSILQGL